MNNVPGAETTPPPPPLFVRAPPEDRSKYEKLFCYDFEDSDPEVAAEEERRGRSRSGHRVARQSHPPPDHHRNGQQEGATASSGATRTKLTDEDSIGSATDLKNGSDEDMDDDGTVSK